MEKYVTYKEMEGMLIKKEPFKGNSVTAVTSGSYYVVYSYDTIMAIVTDDGKAVINVTKYSRTTSKIQNKLKGIFSDARLMIVEKRNAVRDNFELCNYAKNYLHN